MKLTFTVNNTIEELHNLIRKEANRQGFEIEESDFYSDSPDITQGGTEYKISESDEDDISIAILIVSPTRIFLKGEQYGEVYEFTSTPDGVMCTFEYGAIDSFMAQCFVPKIRFNLTGDEVVEAPHHGQTTLKEYIRHKEIEYAVCRAHDKFVSRDITPTHAELKAQYVKILAMKGRLRGRLARFAWDTPPSCSYTIQDEEFGDYVLPTVTAVNGIPVEGIEETAKFKGEPTTRYILICIVKV